MDNISLGEIEPRTFSFNTPHGACPACTGLGTQMEIDPDLIIPDKDLSLAEGAIRANGIDSGNDDSYFGKLIEAVARKYNFAIDKPVRELTRDQLDKILYGTGDDVIRVRYENQFGRMREYETTFEGVIPNQLRRHKETDSDYIRQEIESYMTSRPCPVCRGQRLKPEALAVTIAEKNIVQVTAMSVTEALRLVNDLPNHFSEKQKTISYQILSS